MQNLLKMINNNFIIIYIIASVMSNTKLIDTEIFKQSWNLLEGKWTNVISFIIVYYVIQLASEEIILFFSNDDFSFNSIILLIISYCFSLLLQIGFYKFFLNVARNESYNFGDLWFGFKGKHIHKRIVAMVLSSIIILIGLFIFIIPGIFFAVRLCLVPFFLADKKELSVLDILELSYNTTRGSEWKILVFFLKSIIVIILGLLCLLVGFLWAFPCVMTSFAIFYDTLCNTQSDIIDPNEDTYENS